MLREDDHQNQRRFAPINWPCFHRNQWPISSGTRGRFHRNKNTDTLPEILLAELGR